MALRTIPTFARRHRQKVDHALSECWEILEAAEFFHLEVDAGSNGWKGRLKAVEFSKDLRRPRKSTPCP